MSLRSSVGKWLLLLLLLATASVWAVYFFKEKPALLGSASFTSVQVDNKVKNLGKLKVHSRASAQFILRNTGNEPLTITSVKTDCQCTSPNWSKTPIAPNDSTVIQLIYHGDGPGIYQKKAYVYCNTDDSPVLLVLRGTMEE